MLPEGGVGSLVVGSNGRIVGRMLSGLAIPMSETVDNRNMRFATMALGVSYMTGAVMGPDLALRTVPVQFPAMVSPLAPVPETPAYDLERDFEVMHGNPNDRSAIDHLLEDDDDPIPTG